MVKKMLVEFPDDFVFPEFSGSYKDDAGVCVRCPLFAEDNGVDFCFVDDREGARCPFYGGVDEAKMFHL